MWAVVGVGTVRMHQIWGGPSPSECRTTPRTTLQDHPPRSPPRTTPQDHPQDHPQIVISQEGPHFKGPFCFPCIFSQLFPMKDGGGRAVSGTGHG